jgi:uncharacterized membrane protein (GlpM family)
MYFLVKTAVSALLIALISEIAKRNPGFGALVASLPLVSVIGMLWLWHDTQEPARLATHAEATFWYVLPSLPMFLVVPWLLRRDVPFHLALALGCALTIALYLLMIWIAPRFGLKL